MKEDCTYWAWFAIVGYLGLHDFFLERGGLGLSLRDKCDKRVQGRSI